MNENQKVVLEWLKRLWLIRKRNGWSPCNVIESLSYKYEELPGDEFETTEIPHLKAYGELTWVEQFEVFAVFGKWGMKEETKMKEIYCSYADTEVVSTLTNMECPYCKELHAEHNMDQCGKAYVVTCENCEKEFKMHFDAD